MCLVNSLIKRLFTVVVLVYDFISCLHYIRGNARKRSAMYELLSYYLETYVNTLKTTRGIS